MEKKETKTKKMGRPKKNIVKKTFESLCRLQCTLEEIASHFDCSDTTISRWCKTTYNKTFEVVYLKNTTPFSMIGEDWLSYEYEDV